MLDWLKEILGEAYSEEIDKKVSAQIGKDFVSRADFNGANTAKKTAETQLAAANQTIETLKNSKGDEETLKQTVAEHEKTIERLKKEAENAEKINILRENMRSMGVKDPDYIIYKQGGIDKFAFSEDKKPQQLEETVKEFRRKAEHAHLFYDDSQHYSPAKGDDNIKNPFAKESYNLTEQGHLLRKDPAAAKEMAAAAGITLP